MRPESSLKRIQAVPKFSVGLVNTGQKAHPPRAISLLRWRGERPCSRCRNRRNEHAPPHVWMAPAMQEVMWRVVQVSLAVMCPACCCSPEGLLALMGSANRGLIIRTGSLSR